MKKIVITAALLLGGVIVCFYLIGQKNTSTEPIKIGVAVYPGYGTFYVAQEKGFFAREGVAVELVQLDPNTMLSALASNQVQMLVGDADMMAIVADAGIPAKQIFSTSISYGADGLLVAKNIQTIQDLKGKDVYVAYGFPDHFFFRYLAQKAGLQASDVHLINMDSDKIGSSFVAGKIDAGMTWEPWLSNAKQRPGGKVLVTSRDEPGLITDITMARNDLVTNNREGVKNVMRAFFAAEDWWEKNPSEGNTLVAKDFVIPLDQFTPMMETVRLTDLQTNIEKFSTSTPLNVYEIAKEASLIYTQDGVVKQSISGDTVTDPTLLYEIR